MSNYSQTVFFAPKDALLSGNPAKLIVGAAYDVEFGNIATAIASKPDNLTTSSFLNVNVTGTAVPVNGIYLPSTNTLGFASNTTQRGTVNSAGNWVVNAPSSGTALLVNAASSSAGIISDSAAAYNGFGWNEAGILKYRLLTNWTSSGALSFVSATTGAEQVKIAGAGNVTIAAPSSGDALTVQGNLTVSEAAGLLTVNSTNGSSAPFLVCQVSGTMKSRLGVEATAGAVVTGSSVGDLFWYSAGGNFLFSVNGATAALKIAAAGNVTIAAPSSGATLIVNGVGGGAANIVAQCASGVSPLIQLLQTSNGNWQIYNPASAADLRFYNGTADIFRLTGTAAPTVQGYGPVAGALVDMTPDTASYTGTLTGCTSSPTCTVTLRRSGNTVVCNIGANTAISNVGSCTITGSMPASFQPATLDQFCPIVVEDNGSFVVGYAKITHASSTITLLRGDGALFNTVGGKGIAQATSFSYMLA